MTLNAPRMLFFVIAVVIAIVAVLSVYVAALAAIPISAFWLMTIAFVILALSCVIRGM
jgi:hypothetical protein